MRPLIQINIDGKACKHTLLALVLIPVLALPLFVFAGTVDLGTPLANGQIIDADALNTKFDNIKSAVDDNDARARIEFQTKKLDADLSGVFADQRINDLDFNGLTDGKFYRLTLYYRGTRSFLKYKEGGTLITQAAVHANADLHEFSVTHIFKKNGNGGIAAFITAGSSIDTGTLLKDTSATIEELPGHVEVSTH